MAENEIGESLLRKSKYYEGCPGCKIEHFKETNTGVPFKYLLYVWIVVLCAEIAICTADVCPHPLHNCPFKRYYPTLDSRPRGGLCLKKTLFV